MNETSRTVVEAVLIGVAALGVGLLTNSVNRDGLALDRDYFRTSDAVPLAAHPPAPALAPMAPHAAQPVPATAAAPAGQGTARGVLRVVLLDARLSNVRWIGDITSDPAPGFGAAITASVAAKLAAAVAPQ